MADIPRKSSKSSTSIFAVKKVRPYPIAAMMEFKSIKKPLQIMKLAKSGAWASLGTTLVQVGVTYNLEFELPVSHQQIIAPAKALRTMDRVHEKDGAKSVERLAEFQFVKLSSENLEKIQKYLAAINQTD